MQLMFGFVQFGLTFGTSGIVSYIIDLHRNQSDAAVAGQSAHANLAALLAR